MTDVPKPEVTYGKEDFKLELRWDRLGRKGQRCQILRQRGTLAHVRFEDGFTAMIDRRALKKAP